MTSVRVIEGALEFARACDAGSMPAVQSLASKQGLRYEKHVLFALMTHAMKQDCKFARNPWFAYKDAKGEGGCVPDALMWKEGDQALVIEVKLTYTPAALTKLRGLYQPVISRALGFVPRPLVICKHMTRGAPHAAYSIAEALQQREPVMQWLGYGTLPTE